MLNGEYYVAELEEEMLDRSIQFVEHTFNCSETCDAFLRYFVFFASVTEISKIVLAIRGGALVDWAAEPVCV